MHKISNYFPYLHLNKDHTYSTKISYSSVYYILLLKALNFYKIIMVTNFQPYCQSVFTDFQALYYFQNNNLDLLT